MIVETGDNLRGLADFVRSVRASKKLSQADVARRGGPSAGWIGGLEAGTLKTVPKYETLRRLAKGLAVPLEDVLELVGNAPDLSGALGHIIEFEGLVRSRGLDTALSIARRMPGFASKIKYEVEQRTHLGRHPDDKDDEDGKLRVQRLDTIQRLGREAINLIEGAPDALSEKEFLELANSIDKMQPDLRLPLDKVSNVIREDWTPALADTYLPFPDWLAPGANVVCSVDGGLVHRGFSYGDLLLCRRINSNDQAKPGDEVFFLYPENEPFYGRISLDDRGTYIESHPKSGKIWRSEIKDDTRIPLVLITYISFRDKSHWMIDF